MLKKIIDFIGSIKNVIIGLLCTLIIISIWIINHYYPNCSIFQLNGSNSATIVFGITGGILSLLGLLSIFVSITTQQNIEKCREIQWELEQLKDENSIEVDNNKRFLNISKEYARLLNSYIRIMYEKEGFIPIIIKASRIAIYFVIIMWTASAAFYNFQDSSGKQLTFMAKFIDIVIIFFSTSFGLVILLKFSNILSKLNNFQLYIDLPDKDKLYDARNIKFPILYYIAPKVSLTQKLIKREDSFSYWKIKINYPYEVNNFYIELVGCIMPDHQFFINKYFYQFVDKDGDKNESYIDNFKPAYVSDRGGECIYPLKFIPLDKPAWNAENNQLEFLIQNETSSPGDEIYFLFRLFSFSENDGLINNNDKVSSIYMHFIVKTEVDFGLYFFDFKRIFPHSYYDGDNPIEWWKGELNKEQVDIQGVNIPPYVKDKKFEKNYLAKKVERYKRIFHPE